MSTAIVASAENTDDRSIHLQPIVAPAAPGQRQVVGRRLVRNLFARGTGQLFTWVAAVVITVLMPLYLGDENLGRLTTAIAITDMCGLLASFGITNYLIKEIARRGNPGGLLLNALVLRLPLVVVASFAAIVSASLLNVDPNVRQVIYLLCLNTALVGTVDVLTGVLQGMQEMRAVAVVDVLSKLVLVVGVVVLLHQGYGLLGVAVAFCLSSLAAIVVAVIALWRRGGLVGRIDPSSWKAFLAGSLPFFVWQAALMIYGRVDVIMLSLLTGPAAVGWYAAAYRIIGIAAFAPVIISGVIFPALARSAARDLDEFRAIARRSLQLVLLVTVPMSFGCIVLADPLIGFLHYPEPFRNSVPLIMILALHIPMMAAGMINGSALNALDRQRQWAYTGLAAAALNPALNLILIPFFDRTVGNGAVGAAITTVVTELFMMAIGLYLLRGDAYNQASLEFAVRCVGAGLIMVGVTWLLRDFFLPIPVFAGAATYAVASVALGTVSTQDLSHLLSFVSARIDPGLPLVLATKATGSR